LRLPERVAYGPGSSQFCELFVPKTTSPGRAGPYPVVVLVHGGFWRAHYDRTLQWHVAGDLCERGFAVWNVEYRRVGDGGGWPATFEDVAAAVDALDGTGDERLDLGRVVIVGHSAGGHLALWAAGRAGLPDGAPGAGPRVRPVAAVAQAGVVDLDEASRLRLSYAAVHELLGGSPDEQPERYELASPRRRLPLGVPLLLVHGDRDGNVPVEMSQAFAAAAEAAGDECELVVVSGEGHAEHLEPDSRMWRAVVEWLDR
jgi:acetyl esterase/lipase